MKRFFKKRLSGTQYRKLQLFFRNSLSIINPNNLTKLAKINCTDKGTKHHYTDNYTIHFQKLRRKKLNILEIGVGGYEFADIGGESLRMWKFYFPRSNIYGIDIFDKSGQEEKRIKIFQGSQADREFLLSVCKEIGGIDIIIDDGSHINEHVITTFKILFPLLNMSGIYVVEDIQTAYWPDFGYGGDSLDLNNPNTSMNFFKKLTDGLNYEEFIHPGYQPSYFDKNIKSVHFYHNMVFIYKGPNNEGSNIVLDNKRI
jgi:demethylmacrocin O-methyltransferase